MSKIERRAAQILAQAKKTAARASRSAGMSMHSSSRHGDWVPPYIDLSDLELDVLLDTERPYGHRRLPSSSYVIDRARDGLARRHLLVWKQVHPHHTSLADDHYVLTPGGQRMLARYRQVVRKVAGASPRA